MYFTSLFTLASVTALQFIVVVVQGESGTQSKQSRCIGDESWDMSVNIILKVQPSGQILHIDLISFVFLLIIKQPNNVGGKIRRKK